jgi:hypothetical protein
MKIKLLGGSRVVILVPAIKTHGCRIKKSEGRRWTQLSFAVGLLTNDVSLQQAVNR